MLSNCAPNCPPGDGRDRRRNPPGSDDAVSASTSSADLARAVAEIQLGRSQREILRALLDTSARYAARVALFVVKGSHATGWQGRGFREQRCGEGFRARRKRSRQSAVRSARRSDAPPTRSCEPAGCRLGLALFLQSWNASQRRSPILPLILKDKVAALVYADSGTGCAGSARCRRAGTACAFSQRLARGQLAPQASAQRTVRVAR